MQQIATSSASNQVQAQIQVQEVAKRQPKVYRMPKRGISTLAETSYLRRRQVNAKLQTPESVVEENHENQYLKFQDFPVLDMEELMEQSQFQTCSNHLNNPDEDSNLTGEYWAHEGAIRNQLMGTLPTSQRFTVASMDL